MGSDGDGRGKQAEDEARRASGHDDPRLGRLGDAIAGLRRPPPSEDGPKPVSGGFGGLGLLLRMGSEFVAGVVVGFVIGYTIDRLFGTTPWGMVAFLLIGFAAGTLNVMRAAGVMAERFPPSGRDGRKDGD